MLTSRKAIRRRLRQRRRVSRTLTAAALTALTALVLLSGTGGSYALLKASTPLDAGTVTAGTIHIELTGFSGLSTVFHNAGDTVTAPVTISNTGTVAAPFTSTLSLAPGSSPALDSQVWAASWSAADPALCTASAATGSSATPWAGMPVMTGTLPANSSFTMCVRAGLATATGVPSGSTLKPTAVTALTIGSWSSTASDQATQTFVDITPPTAPTGFSSSSETVNTLTLTWSATDNVGVAGYDIHRAGSTLPLNGVTRLSSPGFTESGLAAGTAYSYTVVAWDAVGHSATSAPVTVRTPNELTCAPPDGTSPATFTWAMPADAPGDAAYAVYVNGAEVLDAPAVSFQLDPAALASFPQAQSLPVELRMNGTTIYLGSTQVKADVNGPTEAYCG